MPTERKLKQLQAQTKERGGELSRGAGRTRQQGLFDVIESGNKDAYQVREFSRAAEPSRSAVPWYDARDGSRLMRQKNAKTVSPRLTASQNHVDLATACT